MRQLERTNDSKAVARDTSCDSQSTAEDPVHTMHMAESEPRGPDELSLKEPQLRKPGIEVTKTDHQSLRLALGVAAVRQTLREMDREL